MAETMRSLQVACGIIVSSVLTVIFGNGALAAVIEPLPTSTGTALIGNGLIVASAGYPQAPKVTGTAAPNRAMAQNRNPGLPQILDFGVNSICGYTLNKSNNLFFTIGCDNGRICARDSFAKAVGCCVTGDPAQDCEIGTVCFDSTKSAASCRSQGACSPRTVVCGKPEAPFCAYHEYPDGHSIYLCSSNRNTGLLFYSTESTSSVSTQQSTSSTSTEQPVRPTTTITVKASLPPPSTSNSTQTSSSQQSSTTSAGENRIGGNKNSGDKDEWDAGTIVGTTLGCVGVLLIAALLLYFSRKYHLKKLAKAQAAAHNGGPHNPASPMSPPGHFHSFYDSAQPQAHEVEARPSSMALSDASTAVNVGPYPPNTFGNRTTLARAAPRITITSPSLSTVHESPRAPVFADTPPYPTYRPQERWQAVPAASHQSQRAPTSQASSSAHHAASSSTSSAGRFEPPWEEPPFPGPNDFGEGPSGAGPRN